MLLSANNTCTGTILVDFHRSCPCLCALHVSAVLHNHDAYAGSIPVYHAPLMSRIFDNDSLKKQPEKYWFSFFPMNFKIIVLFDFYM